MRRSRKTTRIERVAMMGNRDGTDAAEKWLHKHTLTVDGKVTIPPFPSTISPLSDYGYRPPRDIRCRDVYELSWRTGFTRWLRFLYRRFYLSCAGTDMEAVITGGLRCIDLDCLGTVYTAPDVYIQCSVCACLSKYPTAVIADGHSINCDVCGSLLIPERAYVHTDAMEGL